MGTDTTEARYDVVFLARTGGQSERAGIVAENVDKATAIKAAQKYCHKGPLNDGIAITYHGTLDIPTGSEWWFH